MLKDVKKELSDRLQLRPGTADILSSRESSTLEFKKSFHRKNVPAYVRTMIAFANHDGGFVVFGVEPKPHRLCGIDRDKFESIDPAELESCLKNYVSPALNWSMGCVESHGVSLGYLHTEVATDKPVMTTRTGGQHQELKEGEIYYRYKGQTAAIRFPELRQIIEERLERERAAWRKHIQEISRAGPSNVGIMDTVQGKIYGPGATLLIDESLVPKLKFIREGNFSETEGEPTLRLVGDVLETTGIKEKHIPVANLDCLKPSKVVEAVCEYLPFVFNMYHHTKAWRFFKVRPMPNTDTPTNTNAEFCVFDTAHGDYLYTDAWIEKLQKELSLAERFEEVTQTAPKRRS